MAVPISMSTNRTSLFQYWGKADPGYPDEPKWHPLVYHCLDVAAVSAAWWDSNPDMRRSSYKAPGVVAQQAGKTNAWVLFFCRGARLIRRLILCGRVSSEFES